jgi:hypothetical protein
MGIRHHPTAQLISDYVTANISPGVALAVAMHLESCTICALAASTASRPAGPERIGRADPPSESALSAVAMGPWIGLRKGVLGAVTSAVSGLGEAVYLLKAEPGADIGTASVRHAFLILVLKGRVKADGRTVSAGDLLELATPPEVLLADTPGASLLVVAEDLPLRLRRREG